MNLTDIYNHLPLPIQNLAVNYYGWRESNSRLGALFNSAYNNLCSSDYFTTHQITALQNNLLDSLVRTAFELSPFYRARINKSLINLDRPFKLNDLSSLPILTRYDVSSNFTSILGESSRRKDLIPSKTSGTTGTQLKFVATKYSKALQWAT